MKLSAMPTRSALDATLNFQQIQGLLTTGYPALASKALVTVEYGTTKIVWGGSSESAVTKVEGLKVAPVFLYFVSAVSVHANFYAATQNETGATFEVFGKATGAVAAGKEDSVHWLALKVG